MRPSSPGQSFLSTRSRTASRQDLLRRLPHSWVVVVAPAVAQGGRRHCHRWRHDIVSDPVDDPRRKRKLTTTLPERLPVHMMQTRQHTTAERIGTLVPISTSTTTAFNSPPRLRRGYRGTLAILVTGQERSRRSPLARSTTRSWSVTPTEMVGRRPMER